MKIENSFIIDLINTDDPLNVIFQYIKKLLKPDENNYFKKNQKIEAFYKKELQIRELEVFLLKTFSELYDNYLTQECLKFKNISNKNPIIFMDGLSLREAILFQNDLKDKYSVDLDYSFSSLPSDTINFKSNCDLNFNSNCYIVNDSKLILMNGNEKIYLSSFPDAFMENIQEGNTIIQTIPEIYNKTFKILTTLLDRIESKNITIISDHGYISLEPEHVIPIDPSIQKLIAKVMGGRRYRLASEINADKFVREGFLVKANNFYIVKSRYTWPISGRYKILQHGGLSLMECFTPILNIKK
ncbi:MAG: hypothetical protein ACTSQP_18455 [Promethearchaeota archaeon]